MSVSEANKVIPFSSSNKDESELISLTRTLTKLVDVLSETLVNPKQPFNVRCISVEDYAIWLGEPDAIDNIKRWMNPKLPARTCRDYINPADVVRVKGKPKIRFCEIPIKGISYPRFCEKQGS